MFDYYAQKCDCGAITISEKEGEERFSSSMLPSVFKRIFKGSGKRFKWLQKTFSCNHCVNHWGIDLCGCGSGNPVGKCDEGFDECKHKIPAQELFIEKPSLVQEIMSGKKKSWTD